MRRFRKAMLTGSIALLLLPSGCARETKPVSTPAVLPNGLTVIVKENRASDIVSVQAWVRDGALYETPEQAGAAALLSRMLFEQSAKGSANDVVRTIEGMGGWLSVTPSHDFVSYAITAPAEHYDAMVDILANGLMKPSLVPERIDAKKKTLASDWAGGASSPMSRAVWMAYRAMYGDHPYGRPAVGAQDAHERITIETLRERHRARYVPGDIVIVAAGNIDPSHALERIEQAFSSYDAGTPAEAAPAPVAWPAKPVREVERSDVKKAYEAIAFPAPSVQDPDNVVMDLILMVLGRGRSSRLERVLVDEKQLVDGVKADYATRTQPSPIFAYMELPPENARAAEEATVAIFRSLAQEAVGEAELAKAKTLLESEILFGNETAEGQAFYYGYWTVLGGTAFVDDYLARLKTITADDLKRVAGLYFTGNGYAAAVVEPRSAEEP